MQSVSQEKENPPQLSLEYIKHNLNIVSRSRAFLAIVTGLAAGILGLESLYGFLFYLICTTVYSCLLLVKTGFKPWRYYPSSEMIFTYDVFGNLSSFVLFWVLAYGVVHIYE